MKKTTCQDCDSCCKHVAIEIDKPTTQEDYNNIVWYLMHENMHVFVDHDNGWYLEFNTRCKALQKDKKCGIYKSRPSICRKYSADTCVQEGGHHAEKYSFGTREEFLKFLKKKGKKYYPTGKKNKV